MSGINMAGSAAWNTAVFFVQTTANNSKERLIVICDVKEWTAGDWTCCALVIIGVANACFSKSKFAVAANFTGVVLVIIKWSHNHRANLNLEQKGNNAKHADLVTQQTQLLATQALHIQKQEQLGAESEARSKQFAENATALNGENQQLQAEINQLRGEMAAERTQRTSLQTALSENQASADALSRRLEAINNLPDTEAAVRSAFDQLTNANKTLEQAKLDIQKSGGVLEALAAQIDQKTAALVAAGHQAVQSVLAAATTQPTSHSSGGKLPRSRALAKGEASPT